VAEDQVPGVPGVEDPARLAAWMSANAGEHLGRLSGVTLIAGGRSNLTYRLDMTAGPSCCVARRWDTCCPPRMT